VQGINRPHFRTVPDGRSKSIFRAMRAHATVERSEPFVRGLGGLRSLRLTRVAPAGVTPEGLVESKTRAGAMDGTGSWSTAG